MEEINTIYMDMPTAIHSFVVSNADATYTIVLNARMSQEQHLLSYNHELQHIDNGDYEKLISIGTLETMAHAL